MTTHIFKTILNLTERGKMGTNEIYILFQKKYVDCSWFFFGKPTKKKTPMEVYDHYGEKWDMSLFNTDTKEYRIPSLGAFFDHYHVVAGDIIVFEAHEINGQITYSISHEKGRYDNLLLWSRKKQAVTVITSKISDLSVGHYHIMVNGTKMDLNISIVPNGYEILTPILDKKGKPTPLNKALSPFEYFTVDANTHEIKPINKISVQTISR